MADQISTTAQGVPSANVQGTGEAVSTAASTTTPVIEETFDKERALETIRKQRASEDALTKENKRLAKIVEEHDKSEKARRDAELSETEKLKNQIAEKDAALQTLQNDLKTWRIRQAVEREATALGFQNPEDAYLLADMSGVAIGEDGKVTGAKEAIEKLAKARAYLLKTEKPTPPDVNARNRSTQTQDVEARQKELAQRFRIKI